MPDGQAATQPALFHGTEQQLQVEAANRILEAPEAPEAVTDAPAVEAPEAEAAETASPAVEPAPVEVETPVAPVAATEPEKHKLKVKREDGTDEEVEVDTDGLKRGFMMERDYRAKTAQLAEMRRQEEAKIKSAIEPKLQEYEQKLNTFSALINQTAANELKELTPQLAQTDPARYIALVARRDELQASFNQIAMEQNRIAQQRQAEFQQRQSMQIQEANDALRDPIQGIPDWSPPVYTKILTEGIKNYGFKQEELNAVTDPRIIRALHDANAYRELRAAKPTVNKRVAEVPKVIRPGTTLEVKPQQQSADWDKGMANLKKSGGRESAALSLAAQILERG